MTPEPAHPADPPLVSVIVPVFDVGALAAEAIASLKAQTLTDFEAVVIDDGSTDGSGDIVAAAIGGDPRFRLIRQPNRGLSAARNAGLARARGEWLAFLDADDRFSPGFLSRLIAAAQAAGLPWAASGVGLCGLDGRQVPHSAIHGSPDPAGMEPRIFALDRATEVARHFPSAWNKVYRRDLLAGLRFREGTWFEDHEVFWACADRARALLHLPDALYLHQRGRPGQITGSDDDRVFDLFGVLDHLHPVVLRFSEPAQGLARLATRLIHERAQVLPRGARRDRFLDRAADWLSRQRLAPDDAGADDLRRGLTLRLSMNPARQVPVSVLVPVPPGMTAQAPPLAATLAALERGPAWDGDVTVVRPDSTGSTATGPTELAAAIDRSRGVFVMVIPPGAEPEPGGIAALAEVALQTGADLVLGTLWRGAGHHDGWMDNRMAPPSLSPAPLTAAAALRLYPSCARMLARRDLLRGAATLSPWHPLAEADLLLRAARAARAVVLIPDVVARVPLPSVSPTRSVIAWAARLGLPDAPTLPPGAPAVLALRHLQPGLPPARSAFGMARRLWAAALMRLHGLSGDPATPADPGADRWLRRLAGLRPSDDHG